MIFFFYLVINKAEAFFHSKFAKDYYLSFPECVQKIVSALRKLVLQKRRCPSYINTPDHQRINGKDQCMQICRTSP